MVPIRWNEKSRGKGGWSRTRVKEREKYSEKGKQRISWIYLTGCSNILGIFFLLGEAGGNDNWQTSEGWKKIEGKRKETKIGK